MQSKSAWTELDQPEAFDKIGDKSDLGRVLETVQCCITSLLFLIRDLFSDSIFFSDAFLL